jgi:hypothetical protein
MKLILDVIIELLREMVDWFKEDDGNGKNC